MIKCLFLLLCLAYYVESQWNYYQSQMQQTPQAQQPAPTAYYSKPCYECKTPVVTVVQIPSKDTTSVALQQMLGQQLFLSSLGLGSLGLSPMMMGMSGGMGGLGGGMGGQQGLSQPLQMMAMMHLLQSQGMSYYQQMQMLAMMQMAKRMGGRPVPVQPVIRTTAEYRYPGKNVLFLPPYISTQYKPQKASPMMRKGRPESTTPATIVVAEANTATPPPVTRLFVQPQRAYNRRS